MVGSGMDSMATNFAGRIVAGDGTREAVRVLLGAHELVVQRDGVGPLALPYATSTFELGGFDGGYVLCRSPDETTTVWVAAAGFVDALGTHGGPRVAEQLAPVRGARRRRRAGARIGLAVFLLAVAAIGLGLWLLPTVLDGAVRRLPTSVDREIGDAAFAEMELSLTLVHTPRVTAFLDDCVARLAPHTTAAGDYDFRVVAVADDEQINAFALPGGRIVVFTGLLRAATRPEQVAGVLAHEMAHVTERHGLRNVAHRAGIGFAVSLLFGGATEGLAGFAGDIARTASASAYSREQETAADAEGVRLLLAAGIDPRGFAEFFTLLEDEHGTTERPAVLSWLDTHPDHGSRRAMIEERAAATEEPTGAPWDVDWPALQAELRR